MTEFERVEREGAIEIEPMAGGLGWTWLGLRLMRGSRVEARWRLGFLKGAPETLALMGVEARPEGPPPRLWANQIREIAASEGFRASLWVELRAPGEGGWALSGAALLRWAPGPEGGVIGEELIGDPESLARRASAPSWVLGCEGLGSAPRAWGEATWNRLRAAREAAELEESIRKGAGKRERSIRKA